MLKGSRKYWVLAAACGIMASFLFYIYMQDVKKQYEPDDLVTVAQARVDLSKDSVITQEMIEMTELPGNYIHPDAVQKSEDIVGKIALSDISSGEIILKQKVLEPGAKADRLAYQIPNSKRAVTIGVDSIGGVAGFVQEGDHIDIYATLDVPATGGTGDEEAYTVLALQDIMVLAVGMGSSSEKSKEGAAKTITVAVSPQEASPLILASERGVIRLALRSPVDHARTSVPPLQLPGLLTVPQQ